MQCPVCGRTDCIQRAHEILASIPAVFLPCPECRPRFLDKRLPLPTPEYAEPCVCGKRFIDDVFAHIYVIMVEEGDLTPASPLIDAGSPLVHPGFAMDRPPFLSARSLVLLSSRISRKAAQRLVHEVPEIRGVVKKGDFTPGIVANAAPRTYELYAGCDVRADIFPVKKRPLVMFKQQSNIHIEFPRAGYPKIRSVERHVGTPPVPFFIDACCGIGTLGLAAANLGSSHVILNDAWFAAAFWSAINLDVNREYFQVEKVSVMSSLREMAKNPVRKIPLKIAEAKGTQTIEIYHGDFQSLFQVIPEGLAPVTALDLFEKSDRNSTERAVAAWSAHVAGDVFIP